MTTQAETGADTRTAPTSPAGGGATQGCCRNCHAPLLGPHCYACGQPVSGLVRPLGNLFGDFMDSVFDLDLRVVRSIGPLFRKPGFLTQEFFAGRQVRYVTPFRLFFFLCILAFFVGRLAMSGSDVIQGDMSNGDIASATSEADVIKYRDAELAKLASARKDLPEGPARFGAEGALHGAEGAVSGIAAERIKQLREAAANGKPVPPPLDDNMSFGEGQWDADTNPVKIPALPAFANDWLNDKIGRVLENIQRLKTDQDAYKDAFLGAIPTALFVLVPLFAVLLKLLYVFKRRLYMEHLVVALHSHAFISLDLLLIFTMLGVQHLTPGGGFLHIAAGWAIGLLIAWIPLYLLLMQKRVYQQGWVMTLLKFGVLGFVYSILLSLAIAAAAAASLVWM